MSDPDIDGAVVPACPACGTPRASTDLVHSEGPVETYHCPNCGYEEAGVGDPGLEAIFGDVDDTQYVVELSWPADLPPARVVKALRDLLPHYRDRPLGELRADVESGRPVRHGGLVRFYADELRRNAVRHGLRAEVRPELRPPSFPEVQP